MSTATTTREARLDNGLGVILREDHSAPIASIWTWYRVGSRNERPGITGISHWVEHMQFKGTPTLEKGQIFREISRVGGNLNALTSQDWTAYFETLPVARLDLPLRIEPDRMTSSLFDPAEVASERTVILSERQGAENNPGYALYEEVAGAAFHEHPYRHMVIGSGTDLRRITRDELYTHYRRYYHPANAFVVAVGDFQTEELLARIDQAFGAIPGGTVVPRAIGVVEPLQPGERRVLLRRPAGAPHLRMAFHAPEAASVDLVPLMVAEAVLSGGQPMGFGGGGGMGRSSRLYRALVAAGLARSAGSDMGTTIDPYLFQIAVTALPGGNLAQIEQVIDDELRRLREEPVPNDELARAIRQLEAQFIYSSEGVTNQAYWLGQWEIVDRWQRAESLPEEMRAVTAADVQRVAQRYLDPARRTVGWLEPDGSERNGNLGGNGTETGPSGVIAWGFSGPHLTAGAATSGFERAVLPNAIPVLGQDRPGSGSAVVRVRIPAGAIHEAPDDGGLAHLTARALLRGAAGRSFAQINLRTDELGSSISVDAGRQFVEARVRCLRDDLPEMIALLAQTLLHPDFPEDEVERVRAQQLGAIAEANNDTRASAERLMRRGVYPDPNPLGRRVLGVADRVADFSRAEVQAYHERAFTPVGASIAVVGAIGGFAGAVERISQAFSAWQNAAAELPAGLLAMTNDGQVRSDDVIAGKSQADIAIGIATLSRRAPDYYALDLANLILGRLGLMGRLGAEVRDRHGLAYHVSSQIEPRNDGSLWAARAGVAPADVERAIDATQEELERIRGELVTEEELRSAQSYSVGVLPLALETPDGVAATLLSIEEFGLGLDYLARYPDIINAVTREAVRDAARQHLDLHRAAIGVAGPPAEA